MEKEYPLKEIKQSQSQIRKLSDGFLTGIEESDLRKIQVLQKGKHIKEAIKSYYRNLN